MVWAFYTCFKFKPNPQNKDIPGNRHSRGGGRSWCSRPPLDVWELRRPCPVLHACTLLLRSAIQTIHQTTCEQKHVEQVNTALVKWTQYRLWRKQRSARTGETQLDAEMSRKGKRRSKFTFIFFIRSEMARGAQNSGSEKLWVENKVSTLEAFTI